MDVCIRICNFSLLYIIDEVHVLTSIFFRVYQPSCFSAIEFINCGHLCCPDIRLISRCNCLFRWLVKIGTLIATRIATIATTTKSSANVKPRLFFSCFILTSPIGIYNTTLLHRCEERMGTPILSSNVQFGNYFFFFIYT